MFDRYDATGSGALDRASFKLMVNEMVPGDVDPKGLVEVMKKIDTDGNGKIEFEEFEAMIKGSMKQNTKNRVDSAKKLGGRGDSRGGAFYRDPSIGDVDLMDPAGLDALSTSKAV